MEDFLEHRLLIELSHMYYTNGATQQEIANHFSISRPSVSKYLSKARDLGLVEIIIHDHAVKHTRELEHKLMKKYNLNEVICVTSSYDDSSVKKVLGTAASKYLMRVYKPGIDIGVSAGSTLLEMSRTLSPYTRFEDVFFIPLAGGLDLSSSSIHSHEICAELARRTQSNKMEFYAPILLDSYESKLVFLKQPYIEDVLNRAKNVEVAFIGAASKPIKGVDGSFYNEQVDQIQSEHGLAQAVVGDLSYIFIDEKGKEIDSDWNRRLMSVTLDQLRTINNVVLVAGGNHKHTIIKAACRSGVLNTLITDVETAEFLVKEENNES